MGVIIRIVHKDDDGLPFHVHALVIIPAAFRRVDAIADEDDIAVRNARFRHDAIGSRDHIGLVSEGERLAAACNIEMHGRIGIDFHHRHLLEPVPLIPRLDTRCGQPPGDIADAQPFGGSRGRAAFKRV